MDSVRKARERMNKLPMLLKDCHVPAANYAKCVALKQNVLKDDCAKEFNIFKECILKSAKKFGTK
ncbi:hypothetical protein FHG87_013301, partial [Trinorchestia longiramus]